MTPSLEDDMAAIFRVNDSFYRAFEALDLAAMDRVWADRRYAGCVHPGQEMLLGWPAIRSSWEGIFQGTDRIRFRLSQPHVEVRGDVAWTTQVENIRHGDEVLVGVQSTNLFERTPQGWRLILHHASPISDETGEPDMDFMQ